jgi:galactokinase/mevalonate kinase-like predicted kinase
MIKDIVSLQTPGFGGFDLMHFPDSDGDIEVDFFETKEKALEYLKEKGYIKVADTTYGNEIYYIKADDE